MSFLRLFGVAVCLWYTVIATEHGHLHSPLHTRASADIPDGSFVVDRQRNSNHIRNGAMAKGKIMRKYSKSETAGSYFHDIGQRQMRRLAKRQQGQTGQVQATPEAYYSEYLVPVSIGGQTLMIDMDTGSADFWVFSTYLQSESGASAHTLYDPTKSSNFKSAPGEFFNITYGDGSGARGIVGYDQVLIGSATVTSQAIEMATAVSANFISDTDNDGIMGLAFSYINSVSPNQTLTVFDTLLPTLSQPVFSVQAREDNSGYFAFGEIPSSGYTGDLHLLPIVPQEGYWAFISPIFTVSGALNYNLGASIAVADTGTSLLVVDDAVASAYYYNVDGSFYDTGVDCGGYCYPCDSDLPEFSVSMGDYLLEIPTDILTYAQVNETYCYGSVQNNLDVGGQSLGLQVFGDPVFRSAFVVFENSADFLGLKIGTKSASG